METNSKNFLSQCEAVAKGLEPEIKITDFELVANLGKGGYGKVNLYRHKVTGAEYAIKLIEKSKFLNSGQKNLFAREIEIMYKIHHPNIVRLFTHFEDETNCYIVLEYIKKGNLYSYRNSMPNKVLDAATTANIVVELISALYYLHNMNPPIIHRDIKPENLLLDNDGHLKLTDFGGSNYLEGSLRYTTCGTEIYYSPEMISDQGYDTHVDIWAIGILIFELMVGREPFMKDREHSMKENILLLRINWPKSMNSLARNLITRILKLNPLERPTLEEILQHQFITSNLPDMDFNSKLILPGKKEIRPFVISKQIPGEEDKPEEITNLNNNQDENEKNLEIEEYKSLYENLKIDFEKMRKEKEEITIKKDETEIQLKILKKYMEESKKMFEEELDKKVNRYLEATKTISLNEEEIKRLNQRIALLEDTNKKLEKEIIDSENNTKLKIKKFKDDIKLYQEKINQIYEGKIKDKNEIDSHLLEYADNGMLSLYKKENDDLKNQNNKLMTEIENLNQKLIAKQEDLDLKEENKSNILNKLLKEKEDELNKKNFLINKLYNSLADISNFMNKIQVKNFQNLFDGNSLNNIENIRKMIFNNQYGAKSNRGSSANSKDDYSNKRKTNLQRSSGSNYFT